MQHKNGSWVDVSCDTQMSVVCEMPLTADFVYKLNDHGSWYTSAETIRTTWRAMGMPWSARGWTDAGQIDDYGSKDGYWMYGGTVSLHPSQCEPATDYSSICCDRWKWYHTVWHSDMCTADVRANNGLPRWFGDYDSATSATHIHKPSTNKPISLSFTTSLNIYPAVTRMYTDFETKKTFFMYNPPSNVSWQTAQLRCLELGAGFQIGSYPSPYSRFMWNSFVKAGDMAPLNGRRNGPTDEFGWHAGKGQPLNQMHWWNWAPGKPGSDLCLAMGPNGEMTDVDCFAEIFNVLVCEKYDYWLAARTSFRLNKTEVASHKNFVPFKPFPSPSLYSGSSTMYGMTILISAASCRPADMLVMGESSNWLVLVRDKLCMLQFSGDASMNHYNEILNDIEFKTTDVENRGDIGIMYLYWLDRYLRYILYDEVGGHQYAFPSNRYLYTPLANYNYYPATSVCSNVAGWSRAEIESAAENTATVGGYRLNQRSLLGLERPAPAAAYQWLSTAPLSFTAWQLGQPSDSNHICAEQDFLGSWYSAECDAHQLMCENFVTPIENITAGNTTSGPSLIYTHLHTINWDRSGGLMMPTPYIFGSFQPNAAADIWIETLSSLDSINGKEYVGILGATIQMSEESCDPIDDLAFDVNMTATVTRTPGRCHWTLREDNTLAMYIYFLKTTRFWSWNMDRPFLTFGFLLHTMSSTHRMYQDLSTRSVHAIFSVPGPFNFQQAIQFCASKDNWELSVPDTHHVDDFYRLNSWWDLPFALSRNSSGAFGVNKNGAILSHYYFNWKANEPNGVPGTTDCVMGTWSGWEDTDCNVKQYWYVPCMTKSYPWRGSITWVEPANSYLSFPGVEGRALNASSFTDDHYIFYGATIQSSDCRDLDRYFLTKTHDFIFPYRYERGCVLMLSGPANTSEYNTVLGGIEWRSYVPFRSEVTSTFFYWLDSKMRDVVLSDGKFYQMISGTYKFQPSGVYTYHSARSTCHEYRTGGILAEPTTAEAERLFSLILTAQSTSAYHRDAPGSPWKFQFKGAVHLPQWYPFEPNEDAHLCAAREVFGMLIDFDCNSYTKAIVCEYDAAATFVNFAGTADANLTGSKTLYVDEADPPDAAAFRSLQFGADFLMAPPPINLAMLGFVPSGINDICYGASVQLAPDQCHNDKYKDHMKFIGAAPTGIKVTIDNNTCSLQMKGQSLCVYFRDWMISRVWFYSENRRQKAFTFSWVLWRSPDFNAVYVDTETQQVYGAINVTGSTLTWHDAVRMCKQVGSASRSKWDLAMIEFPGVHNLLKKAADGNTFPLRAVRNPSGMFGYWVNGSVSPIKGYQRWIEGEPDGVQDTFYSACWTNPWYLDVNNCAYNDMACRNASITFIGEEILRVNYRCVEDTPANCFVFGDCVESSSCQYGDHVCLAADQCTFDPVCYNFNNCTDRSCALSNGCQHPNNVSIVGCDASPTLYPAQCVRENATGIGMRDTACNDALYNKIIFCRNDDYFAQGFFGGNIGYARDPQAYSGSDSPFGSMILKPPVNDSYLPANTNDTVYNYGATVVLDREDCREFDEFVFTAMHNDIVLTHSETCAIQISGKAHLNSYNKVMLGMEFRGVYPFRNELTFGYVYWAEPFLRALSVNYKTQKVYMSMGSQIPVVPFSYYAFSDAFSRCSINSLDVAEVETQDEAYYLALAVKKDSYLGATRASSGATHSWPVAGALTWRKWFPLEPKVDEYLCTKVTAAGNWYSTNCSDVLESVTCQSTAWPWLGNETVDMTPPFQRKFINNRLMVYSFAGELTSFIFDIAGTEWLGFTQSTSTSVIYGATVQVSPNQCLDGDIIYFPSPQDSVNATYHKPSCSMILTGTQPIKTYQTLLRSLMFLTKKPDRAMLTFSWSLSTHPSHQRMTRDVELRHAYVFPDVPAPVDWDEAYQRCTEIGPGWTMVTIQHEREIRLMQKRAENNDVPINLVRSPEGAYGYWLDGRWEIHRYVAWNRKTGVVPYINHTLADGNYSHSQDADCVMLNVNTSIFETVVCSGENATLFNVIACEHNNWEFAGDVTHIGHGSQFSRNVNVSIPQVIDNSILPWTNLDTPIYGATVQQPITECYEGDRFIFANTHDWISTLVAADCLVQLVGLVDVRSYNYVLGNISYQGVYPFRSSIVFGFLYWTNEYMRQAAVDFSTGHAYVTLQSSVQWTPSANYSFYPAAALCGNLSGFYPAELSLVSEATESRNSIRLGSEPWIGAMRPAVNASFDWLSGNPAFLGDWHPGEPRIGTNMCARASKFDGWYDADCEAWQGGIVCETNSTMFYGQAARTMTPWKPLDFSEFHNTSFFEKKAQNKPTVYVQTEPIINKNHFNWILPQLALSSFFYGATLQQSLQTCHHKDSLLVDKPPPAFKQHYDTTVCAWTAWGKESRPKYVDLLSKVVYITDWGQQGVRTRIWAWMFWTTPEPRYMDPETRYPYTTISSATNVSWDQAFAMCRELNPHSRLWAGDRWALNLAASKYGYERLPVLRVRNTTKAFASWEDGRSVHSPFLYWQHDKPDGVQRFADSNGTIPEEECVEHDSLAHTYSDKNEGYWDDIPCKEKRYKNIICEERREWEYSGTMMQQINEWTTFFIYDPNMQVYPFTDESLPADSNDEVFGVTLQQPLSECSQFDKFWMWKPHDHIFMMYSSLCTEMFSGRETITVYNNLLKNTAWQGLNGMRVSPGHWSYIFWRSLYDRYLVFDLDSLHVYNYYHSTVKYNVSEDYPYYAARQMCEHQGYYVADILTKDESSALRQGARGVGRGWTSGQRPAPGVIHEWPYSDLQFIDWRPRQPEYDNQTCLVQHGTGGWSSVICEEYQPFTCCEKNTTNATDVLWNITTANLTVYRLNSAGPRALTETQRIMPKLVLSRRARSST